MLRRRAHASLLEAARYQLSRRTPQRRARWISQCGKAHPAGRSRVREGRATRASKVRRVPNDWGQPILTSAFPNSEREQVVRFEAAVGRGSEGL
jgi:hypothetical protein